MEREPEFFEFAFAGGNNLGLIHFVFSCWR
jgi:hypothetical protein